MKMLPNPKGMSDLHRTEHRATDLCQQQGCVEESVEPPSPVGFRDEGAWGYCQYCAYVQPTDPETGSLLEHQARRDGDRVRCNGSFTVPDGDGPVEAKPRPFVDLHHVYVPKSPPMMLDRAGGKHPFNRWCRSKGCRAAD